MNLYPLSDKAIASELGARVKSLRLRRNISQQQLATGLGLSVNSIKALEQGKSKLSTLIAVLRELDALDSLDKAIPEITISPLQLAKLHGKKRKRASGTRGKAQQKEDDQW